MLENDLKEQIVEKDLKILILCADTPSFFIQEWKKIIMKSVRGSKILENLFSSQYLEHYQPYYIGINLPERLPSRIDGIISEENLLKTKVNKFEIIISEHCPYTALTNETLNIINNYLRDGGIFITPTYQGKHTLIESKFSKVSEKNKYYILCKNDDEQSFNELLNS